jgi:hypothetical protein
MASQEEHHVKWGSEHASAMFRQGLRELRGALYPESNVAQQPEYGVYGTTTPGEVAESRRGDERELDDESPKQGSVLGERLREAASRDDVDRENREPPMER